MQMLFGDFNLPCKCNTANYIGNLRANYNTVRIDVGIKCPKCGAEISQPFSIVDVLFAHNVNIRTDLGMNFAPKPPEGYTP